MNLTKNPFLTFVRSKGFELPSLAAASGEKVETLRTVSSGARRLTDRLRAAIAPALGCDPSEIPEPPTRGPADVDAQPVGQ